MIIRDRSTNKFVQLMGSTSDPLLLDVPFPEMTPEELARAEAFFLNLEGAVKNEYAFNMDFDRDADRAAETVMALFREVYLIEGNLDLDLKEH